jgi:hypothetical protein
LLSRRHCYCSGTRVTETLITLQLKCYVTYLLCVYMRKMRTINLIKYSVAMSKIPLRSFLVNCWRYSLNKEYSEYIFINWHIHLGYCKCLGNKPLFKCFAIEVMFVLLIGLFTYLCIKYKSQELSCSFSSHKYYLNIELI